MTILPQKFSPLYATLSALLMSEDLRRWSPYRKQYNHLNISKDDIPELLQLAINLDLFDSEVEEEYWVPVHAWRILYELNAKNTVNDLLLLFDKYYDSDFASEELYQIIAILSEGNCLEELAEHLLNRSKHPDSRTIALNAIELIAQEYNSYKNQCIDILADCLDNSDENLQDFNGFLVASLISLDAVSKIEVIRNAFYNNIVNLSIAGDLEDAELELGLRKKRDTPRPKFIIPNLHNFFNQVYQNDSNFSYSGKIGRNDRCPCGSGKKYKKCCIDTNPCY